MKIGIDVRTMETGHKFRGIGAYSENLIKNISELDDKNEYIFFCQKMPSSASKIIENKKFIHSDFLIRKPKDPLKYNWYLDQIYFPNAIKKSKVDLVHILDQLSCLFSKNVKTVVTVHDLIQILDYCKGNFKNKIKLIPVKNADRIIAISQSVKNDLIKILKIDPAKIKIIYNGYDKKIFYPEKNSKSILFFRKKILKSGNKKYLLYIGSFEEFEPRKNINFLIDVFEKLAKNPKNKNLMLVMIGKTGQESERIKAVLNTKKISNKVVFVGYIKHQDLRPYFQAAEIFLFPSLYEGFGLPPLEAMASGTPTISANTTSLPEVVGRGGVLLSPTDKDAWVENIEKIIDNDKYREQIVESGRLQADKFSWKQCAKEVIETYHEVINEEN